MIPASCASFQPHPMAWKENFPALLRYLSKTSRFVEWKSWKIFHVFGGYGCNTNFRKRQNWRELVGFCSGTHWKQNSVAEVKMGNYLHQILRLNIFKKSWKYYHLGLVWFGVEHPTPIHPEIEAYSWRFRSLMICSTYLNHESLRVAGEMTGRKCPWDVKWLIFEDV